MKIIRLVFLTFFLILGFAASVYSAPTCGFVLDGSKPLVDIDTQADTTVLRANWYGFDPNAPSTTGGSTGSSTGNQDFVFISLGTSGTTGGSTGFRTTGIRYEVALISEKLANDAIWSSGGNASTSHRCRKNQGFVGKSDVLGFTEAFPDIAQGRNGFIVNIYTSETLKLVKGVRYYVVLKATHGGKTIYSNSNGVVVGEGGSSYDDDDTFPAYKAGLIAMGIAIYCLLLLLLLLVLVAKGKGEDKYTTTVHRNENVDKL